MTRDLDAASLRNGQSVADSPVPRLPRSHILIGSGAGSCPEVAARRSVKVEQVSATQWILDRASVLAYIRDLNRVLMQAHAVPYRQDGRMVGYRITSIWRGSIYEKIGLQNGDVLLRVNAQKLDDPAKIFGLYQEMRNKRHISLLLSRNGQDQTFDYEIQ